jgi:Bacterial SH3 domain
MLPLPKFLTLPAILSTLFPPPSPGKASEVPERWIINGFYLLVGWALLGAPNWSNVSAPKISLPKLPEASTPVTTPVITQTTAFTTETTTTAVKPVATSASGILVTCPNTIRMVNIRQGAGLTTILATVPCGDRVNLLGSDRIPSSTETWVPVEYKGIKGWVTARYLRIGN